MKAQFPASHFANPSVQLGFVARNFELRRNRLVGIIQTLRL
jgi:hypothetical protein